MMKSMKFLETHFLGHHSGLSLDYAGRGDREDPLAAEQSPSPSRSSSARSLSPPVYTPTIRRVAPAPGTEKNVEREEYWVPSRVSGRVPMPGGAGCAQPKKR
jgi:hypothetical protein